jgi:hypothetical protein
MFLPSSTLLEPLDMFNVSFLVLTESFLLIPYSTLDVYDVGYILLTNVTAKRFLSNLSVSSDRVL